LTLTAFAATTLALISAKEVAGFFTHTISPKIISPIEFMFQFDFSGKWWQYCCLAGALITGWVFVQAKEVRVDIDHSKDVVQQVDRIKLMTRVRNVLSMAHCDDRRSRAAVIQSDCRVSARIHPARAWVVLRPLHACHSGRIVKIYLAI
jgi:hypothetical protein